MRETAWIKVGDARVRASLSPEGKAVLKAARTIGPETANATVVDPLELDRLIAVLADLHDGMVAILSADDEPAAYWSATAHATCDWDDHEFDGSGVAS